MEARDRFETVNRFTEPVLTAALAAFLLLTLLCQWVSICGTSPLSNTALCVAVAAGVAGSRFLRRRIRAQNLQTIIAGVTGVLTVVTAPVCFEFCLRLGAGFGLSPFAVWMVAALPAAGALACCLLFDFGSTEMTRRRVIGCVAGVTFFAVHAWLFRSFTFSVILLGGCVVGIAVRRPGDTADFRPNGIRTFRSDFGILQMLMNVAAGTGVVAGILVLHRVFSVSLIAICAGIVCTGGLLLVAMIPQLQLKYRPRVVWAGSLVVIAILPWFFTGVVNWNLHLRATISTGMEMVFWQGFQLAVWSVPLLMAAMSGCRFLESGQCRTSNVHPVSFCLGSAIPGLVSHMGISPVWPALTAVGVIAVVPVMLLWRVANNSDRFGLIRLTGVLSASAAVIGIFTLLPEMTGPSRLLFSMRPIAAIHHGVPADMISESDAVRLADSYESAEGTVTTWKQSADALEIRVNGHSVGEISTNTSTTPQPVAEVLTCVLPLVMHQRPGSVLLMSDYSGVALRTCRQFPLHRVTVVRPPAAHSQLTAVESLEDGEIEIVFKDPEIVIRDASVAPVDVLISVLADPLRSASLSRLSTCWFRAVSERLTADGVFCQRIRQQHIGRESVLQILARVSEVFENVAMVRMGPGEIALLGSNSSVPLLDSGVLMRMSRRHVQRELSRCGWDWCQLAALPVVDSADPIGLWNHYDLSPGSAVNTGSLSLRLGWETVQSVNHAGNVHKLLAPHQMRIAQAVPSGPTHEEFRRRISAYAQQVEILTAFPDQPGVYRKSLKSEMQRNPRRPVEVFRDGKLHRLPHPLDEHRKAYLTTLGEVLKQVRSGPVSLSELQRLSDFSVDYEPLISDFVHHELVSIHERAGHPEPRVEFQHRLHTIHYTQPGDYSVRNVVAALKQLTEQPEIVDNDVERFDHLNDLVQELILRWEARTEFEPTSAVRMQRDVELSIQVTQIALQQMEKIFAVAGKKRERFLTRRQFVSKALIGPLRDYEQQVLAHRAKHEPLVRSREEPGETLMRDDELPAMLDQTFTN